MARAAVWRGWALATLLCALFSAAHALYPPSGPVLSDLTDANYRTKLKGLVLLELYAPCVPALRALELAR